MSFTCPLPPCQFLVNAGRGRAPPAEHRIDCPEYAIDADRAIKGLFFAIRYKIHYQGHKQGQGGEVKTTLGALMAEAGQKDGTPGSPSWQYSI